MSDDELTDALREAEATLARTYGTMLSLVREAEERKLASRSGARSTATLLATTLRLTRREARTRVVLATAGLDLTDKALSDGLISFAHMKEIHRVLKSAPDSVSAENLAEAERLLVELSQKESPTTIRQAALRMSILQVPVDERTRNASGPIKPARSEFRYWMTANGQMKFAGLFDRITAHQLRSLFLSAFDQHDTDEQEQSSTMAERHGEALADIIDMAARAANEPSSPANQDADAAPSAPAAAAARRGTGRAFLDRVRLGRLSRIRKTAPRHHSDSERAATTSRQDPDQLSQKDRRENKHRDTAA
jgi:hypothetical protein